MSSSFGAIFFDAGILTGNLSLLRFAMLLAAAAIAGLARGFSGFGGALIFMPIASSIVGPRTAAPLLLVIDAFAALGMLPDAWRQADRRAVGIMSTGALAGIPLGTAVLVLVDQLTVRWIIVAIVVMLLALLISGWRYHGRPSSITTLLVGVIGGLFSGASQIGGPPIVAYWLGVGSHRSTMRANIVLYFAASTAIACLTYLIGRLITLPVLGLCLSTGPVYGLVLYAGTRLFGLASETTFRWICYGLIAAAAILGLPALDPVLHHQP